ncbi:hypothetical protein FH972_026010 [Carpinus fangiana]|uniref:Uncharacterized protein n=1 Tax=Carpinus fangiana TaxID=176857 RepID=A0A5N6L2P3_9ROSI|nr:hypothetical protein FH972_026010 [Carpinus fangiana]
MSDSHLHSTGRGGAGNIGRDDTAYAEGGIVHEIDDAGPPLGSTGRGGAGNIGSPKLAATKPSAAVAGSSPLVKAHAVEDDRVPETDLKEAQDNFHTGRGGAGNEHKKIYGGHSTKAEQEAAEKAEKVKKEGAGGKASGGVVDKMQFWCKWKGTEEPGLRMAFTTSEWIHRFLPCWFRGYRDISCKSLCLRSSPPILSNASSMTTEFPRMTTMPTRTFSPLAFSSTASSRTIFRKTYGELVSIQPLLQDKVADAKTKTVVTSEAMLLEMKVEVNGATLAGLAASLRAPWWIFEKLLRNSRGPKMPALKCAQVVEVLSRGAASGKHLVLERALDYWNLLIGHVLIARNWTEAMFKKSTRRAPRKIGQDDEQEQNDASPQVVVKPKSKSRVPSSFRTSLAASTVEEGDDDDDGTAAIRPRKVGLNSAAADRLPIRETSENDTYTADYLKELKSATPNRPSSAANQRWEEQFEAKHVDVVTKFGSKAVSFDLTRQEEDSHLPSAAEIKEKKERRRRLALEEQAVDDQEEDFISLSNTGSGATRIRRATPDPEVGGEQDLHSRSLIIPADEYEHKSKWGETRLDNDDEDIAEGFDEFVDDPGRVVMGRAGLKEQERIRRMDIEKQIRIAQRSNDDVGHEEDNGDDDIEDEDATRIRAYEASQTRHGTVSGGAHMNSRQREKEREERQHKRLHEVPTIRPIPDVDSAVARFRGMVTESQAALRKAEQTEQDLAKERDEIEREEVRLQGLLKEAGDRFEKLKNESMSIAGNGNDDHIGQESQGEQGRGLESLSSMSSRTGLDALAGVSQDGHDNE